MKRSKDIDSSDDDESAVEEKGLKDSQQPSCSKDNNTSVKLQVPYILESDFYEILSRDEEGNVKAKCNKCLHKVISENVSTTGNFRTHYKLKHSSLLPLLDAKKAALANTKREKPGRKDFADLFTKRQVKKDGISQEEAMNVISEFIVDEMLPLSTVEKSTFRNMCTQLSRGTKQPLSFPNRRTFLGTLKQRKDRMIYSIRSKLEKSDFVCTTADLWTAHNKSYLGVTCHLIDKETLERESYVLAIRRMLFRHTQHKIAESLYKIHEEFEITEKITKTVTDNASNFGKAFDVYRLLALEEDESDTSTPQQDGDDEGEEEEEDDDLMPVPINEILNEAKMDEDSNENVITLPKHMRCVSHTINLIVTTDIAKIKDNKFNAKYKAAFGKMLALWNLAARSTNAAGIVERVLQAKLPAPNKTRWFALLRAVKSIPPIKN